MTKLLTATENQIGYSKRETSPGRWTKLYLFHNPGVETPYTLKVVNETCWDGERDRTYYYSAKSYPELLTTKVSNRDGDAPVEALYTYNLRGLTEYLHEEGLIPEWVGKELIFEEIIDSNLQKIWKKAKVVD